ncbi:MAG TPA: OmpA family protein [Kofleriaceae bacterium]|nr:OmpA family protein [Kofleriaceae bacterium]
MKGLFLALSLVALVAACGGKNKKRMTAGGNNDDTGNYAGGDDSGGKSKSAKNANLNDVIYFAFDKSDLDEESRKKLSENADWLKKDPARTLTIEGHTDEVGTPEYNLGLGERRARTTKDYLVRLGIQEKRISIITYGEERPAGSDDSKNRRSMFIATKKK